MTFIHQHADCHHVRRNILLLPSVATCSHYSIQRTSRIFSMYVGIHHFGTYLRWNWHRFPPCRRNHPNELSWRPKHIQRNLLESEANRALIPIGTKIRVGWGFGFSSAASKGWFVMFCSTIWNTPGYFGRSRLRQRATTQIVMRHPDREFS